MQIAQRFASLDDIALTSLPFEAEQFDKRSKGALGNCLLRSLCRGRVFGDVGLFDERPSGEPSGVAAIAFALEVLAELAYERCQQRFLSVAQ